MAFIKDPDAYTRGSGAIASSDYRNPRRAQERRARLARSAQVDRDRAEFTFGARGGLGRIDGGRLQSGGFRPQIVEGGSIDVPYNSGVRPGLQTPTQTTPTGPTGGGRPGILRSPRLTNQVLTPTRAPGFVTGTGQNPPKGGNPSGPRGSVVKPPVVRPPKTIVVSSGSGGITTGTTGGGTSSGGSTLTTPTISTPTKVCWDGTVMPVTATCPDQPVATAPAASGIPWLWIALAGGAAYLIYQNSKETP